MKNDLESKNKNSSFLKNIFSRSEFIFGASFIVIFFLTFSFLYVVGLIPTEFLSSNHDTPSIVEKIQSNSFQKLGLEDKPGSEAATSVVTPPVPPKPAENPIRIEALSISLSSVIVNPVSPDYRTLDNALLKGAVRYPGSGTVEEGNMFIFAHSTGYRVVNNKAYKTFNNIHTLKEGDEINIYTASQKYTYKVIGVRLENSNHALVDFSNDRRMLTLSTCNSFGQKTDRYVVEAIFDHSIDM